MVKHISKDKRESSLVKYKGEPDWFFLCKGKTGYSALLESPDLSHPSKPSWWPYYFGNHDKVEHVLPAQFLL